MVIGTIRGRIMQMMNKNDPVPDQEMLSLTNSKKKKKSFYHFHNLPHMYEEAYQSTFFN